MKTACLSCCSACHSSPAPRCVARESCCRSSNGSEASRQAACMPHRRKRTCGCRLLLIRILDMTALPDRCRQSFEHAQTFLPADAAVGNRLSVGQLLAGDLILTPFYQMRFSHDADDARVAVCDLTTDLGAYRHLVFRLLRTVGMRGIDHHPRSQASCRDFLACRIDAGGVIVRRLAATQNDVAILVAAGRNDGRVAALGHRQEMMRLRCSLDRIDRDLDIAVGAVLE